MIRWVEPPRKAAKPALDPADEYWDVVPIPFFPDDLPMLHFTPLTADQLEYVFAEQRRILFPLAADSFSL